jgi:Sulfatase-modifying factor enzyme 1
VATPSQAVWKVLRGGSWNNNADNARCAVRNRNNPDNRNNNIGFRVVLRSPTFFRPFFWLCVHVFFSGRRNGVSA